MFKMDPSSWWIDPISALLTGSNWHDVPLTHADPLIREAASLPHVAFAQGPEGAQVLMYEPVQVSDRTCCADEDTLHELASRHYLNTRSTSFVLEDDGSITATGPQIAEEPTSPPVDAVLYLFPEVDTACGVSTGSPHSMIFLLDEKDRPVAIVDGPFMGEGGRLAFFDPGILDRYFEGTWKFKALTFAGLRPGYLEEFAIRSD